MEAHFPGGFGGGGHELADGIEDEPELAVVFLFDFLQLAGEVGIGAKHLAEADKVPHDGDIYLHAAVAAQDAGKHGDALLGEGHRDRTSQLPEAWYHIL